MGEGFYPVLLDEDELTEHTSNGKAANMAVYKSDRWQDERIPVSERDVVILQARVLHLERNLQYSDEKLHSAIKQLEQKNEEQAYQQTTNQLFDIIANCELETQDKLEAILFVGLEYFELDVATVSMISGGNYTVKSVVSALPLPYTSGATFDLDNTICGNFIEKSSYLAIDNLSESSLQDLPCYEKTAIESFIGVSLQTVNGPYGSLSFTAQKARSRQFSPTEERLSRLIGGWISYLVGNTEQLEFLAARNDYYSSLLRKIPAMMFFADSEGLILSATDVLAEKVGLEADDTPGMNCVKFFHADDKDKIIEVLKSGVGYCLPVRVLEQSGSTLDVELSLSVKLSGALTGVRLVVALDVSERNKAALITDNQNKQLEIANENLRQFASIASHDLQEPLRIIQQFAGFLEEDNADQLTKDGREHLNAITDASHRMSALIRDLLMYSSATQVEPDMEEVCLNTLLDEVLLEFEYLLDDSKAEVAIAVLPTVIGSKLLLGQLFNNLIGNAIKYRSLDRTLRITIDTLDDDNNQGVVVIDNGIGFDMSYSKQIFEPFNRLHTNKEYQGTGIGLAICNTVCSKHGWGLTAESEPGIGTTFIVRF